MTIRTGRFTGVILCAILFLSGALSYAIIFGGHLPTAVASATGSASSPLYFNHIVVIAFENQPYTAIIGSSSTPFINSIAGAGSVVDADAYCGSDGTCPSGGPTSGGCSAGCYTAFTSGNQYGVSDGVGVGSVGQTSIFDQVSAAGLTWQGYCENGCPRSADHFSCLQYTSTASQPECTTLSGSLISNTGTIGASSANYIWLTPDDSDNMHNTSPSTGDSWLKSFLVGSGSLSSPAAGSLMTTSLFASSAKTLLVLWWDECSSSCSSGPYGHNDKAEVYYMPGIVKSNLVGTVQYNDFNTLLMIQNNWGLACLSNTCSATSLSEIFSSSTSSSPDFSLTANPTIVSFPVGGGAASTVTMVPLGGFAGTVGLTVTSPFGVSTVCSSLSLSPAVPASICTFNATSTASGTVTITGASGTLSHSASIRLTASVPSCTGSCGSGSVPILTGWGAVKLAEVETTIGGVNDFEAHLQLLQKMGYNSVRVEWQSPCTGNEGSGAYTNTDFQNAATLAKKYNVWLIMDWLSGTDIGNSCFMSNWRSIIQYADTNINYSQIIWEPQNEPMSSVGITQLTYGYQSFLNMARQMGDNRWVVVSNLCIQSCESNPSPGGWPSINDTAQHVLMDWHSYMYYPYWSGQGWTNATADTAANFDYQFTLSALQVCSWCKLINTEIGADPIGGSPPDATPSGASGDTCDGYTTVTLHFVQDLIGLFKSANISWTGWGIGSWLTNLCGSNSFEGNLSGQISYGSLQSPLGWGLQLAPKSVAPDFGLSASPSSISAVQGSTGASVITLTSLNSFTGTVTLSGQSSPSGVTITINPSSLTVTAGGQATSSLSISTTGSTPAGIYTIVVTGTSGGSSHSVILSFTVTSLPTPDFGISGSPLSVSAVQGTAGTSAITLTSLNSFAGSVALSGVGSASSITVTITPSSLTLTAGGQSASTLTISTTSSTSAGSYSITVDGVAGTLSHSVIITFTVTSPPPAPDFAISTSPDTLTIVQGSSGSSTITLTSLSGFAGTVTLASTMSTSSVTASFGSNSIALSSGGTGTSTLTISAASSTVVGTYSVTVNAMSGSLSHSVTISVTVVMPPDFLVSRSPSSVSIPKGSSGLTTLTLTSLNGFTGGVSLSATSSAPGFGLMVNPTTPSLTTGGSASSSLTISPGNTVSAGTYSVTITGTGARLSHSVTLIVIVTVPVVQPLQASMSWNPSMPTVGQTVTFTASALNGLPPYSFQWTFGDGSTSSGTMVIHSYSAPGNYTVGVVVVDALSITAPKQSILTVFIGPSVPIVLAVPGSEKTSPGSTLSFTINASNPQAPGMITISVSNMPPGAVFVSTPGNPATGTFSWDPRASDQAGSYNVTFSAVQSGSSYSSSKTVMVDLAGSPSTPCFLCGSSWLWQAISLAMIGATVGLLLTFVSVPFLRAHKTRPKGLSSVPQVVSSMPSRVAVTPFYGNLRTPYGIRRSKVASIRRSVPTKVTESRSRAKPSRSVKAKR